MIFSFLPRCQEYTARIPLKSVRAGPEFAALIPRDAQDNVKKAFKKKGRGVEEVVSGLDHMTVKEDGEDRVRVFCG